jgi:hypothetical protein
MAGMERQAQSSVPAVLLGIAIATTLFASYVTGYFMLGTPAMTLSFCRVYESRWLAIIYQPAAWAESVITGDKVETCYTGQYP